MENSHLFREEDLRKGHYFRIHPQDEPGSVPVHTDPPPQHQVIRPQIEQSGKRTVKSILKDASRQIFASFIILVLGFLLLNGSAYY
ncbi:MAG: hypothetical protein AAB953_02940, partial [Patescibacteria group bacterium]